MTRKTFSTNYANTKKTQLKFLETGDMFVPEVFGDGEIYVKTNDSTFLVHKGIPFEQNAFCINTGCAAYFNKNLWVFSFDKTKIKCE